LLIYKHERMVEQHLEMDQPFFQYYKSILGQEVAHRIKLKWSDLYPEEAGGAE